MISYSKNSTFCFLFSIFSLLFLFSIFYFLDSTTVLAAEISLSAKTQETVVGRQFQMDISLNTDNEGINAVEGKIIFPSDILELKEIRTANSIINFWVDPVRNCVSNGVKKPDEICFAGITPGGYQGEKGLLFSLIFLPKKEGQGAVGLEEAKTLLNDGKGTEAPLSISPYQFTISQAVSAAPSVSQVLLIIDKESPESFMPEVAQDSTIFNGKYFLVFATQDKGSGIDHYEVCEGQRKCVTAEIPYLLQNQDLDEKIVVKAIDKSGNERIVTLPAQKQRAWYKNYGIIAILIIAVVVVAYLIWKILWKKRKK